jgi:hypothetical protein
LNRVTNLVVFMKHKLIFHVAISVILGEDPNGLFLLTVMNEPLVRDVS